MNGDALLALLLRASAGLAGAIVLLIAVFLVRESLPAFAHVGLGRLFGDASWHPNALAAEGTFNFQPMLWGTLIATLGALLLAAPLGVLSAVFLHFYAPPAMASIYRRLIELLAGIPSVVYGLWGLVVLVPLILQLHPPGPSLLAGVLILALMILPTIALLCDAALAAVPAATLRGAAALAMGRWNTVLRVMLPSAKSGIFTGIILGAGRALGETMAILMVCGNIVQLPHSLFDPIRTLTANIALEMAYALGDHRAALFASGLLLLVLVMLLTAATEALSQKKLVPHA